jgi:gliding motility-associated lipoprotein GldH
MFYKMLGNKYLTSIFIVFVFACIAACQTKQLYEQNTIYPNHNWAEKQVNNYAFSITDTSAAYNVFFVIRHHNAYHYKNIFIQLNTTAPDNTTTQQLVDLNLADESKGWLGIGMGDIYDQRIPVNASPLRFKKGLYKFALSHTMREDPLENILSTGIRVEKVKP